MKNTIGLLLILFLSSCNQNDDLINQLRSENEHLKIRLQFVEDEIHALEFRPIFIARNDTIREGEVYESNIGMVIRTNKQVASVSIGEIINDKYLPISDSLEKTHDLFRVFNYSELTKGEHELYGEVSFKLLDSTYRGLFSSMVYVKE